MSETLGQYPEPVYQKTYLLDLPSEMLHRIMSFAYKRDAMCMGAACHRLHQIAASYVFEASRVFFVMLCVSSICIQASRARAASLSRQGEGRRRRLSCSSGRRGSTLSGHPAIQHPVPCISHRHLRQAAQSFNYPQLAREAFRGQHQRRRCRLLWPTYGRIRSRSAGMFAVDGALCDRLPILCGYGGGRSLSAWPTQRHLCRHDSHDAFMGGRSGGHVAAEPRRHRALHGLCSRRRLGLSSSLS
jgi:hypothetical protein